MVLMEVESLCFLGDLASSQVEQRVEEMAEFSLADHAQRVLALSAEYRSLLSLPLASPFLFSGQAQLVWELQALPLLRASRPPPLAHPT